MIAKNSSENKLYLLEQLLRVRNAETMLAEKYKLQIMKTPTHFGVGQEAVAVGVCAAIDKSDYVYSHHRSHNHYIAKGGDFYALAAELLGRESGCSKGRGGSVHLTDFDAGFVASTAILGETVAAAVGSALSISMDKKDNVVVSFFGDATLEEGIFYECLIFASLKNLPVLFVCENNGYATESPIEVRQPEGTSFCDRVNAFGVKSKKIDGNDVEKVFEETNNAIQYMSEHKKPFFLECTTYRWLEHVGPNYDHDLNRTYRTVAELEKWKEKCPVKRLSERLLHDKIITDDELNILNNKINEELNSEFERAQESSWPSKDTLFENTY